jgi:hypothetical protein
MSAEVHRRHAGPPERRMCSSFLRSCSDVMIYPRGSPPKHRRRADAPLLFLVHPSNVALE